MLCVPFTCVIILEIIKFEGKQEIRCYVKPDFILKKPQNGSNKLWWIKVWWRDEKIKTKRKYVEEMMICNITNLYSGHTYCCPNVGSCYLNALNYDVWTDPHHGASFEITLTKGSEAKKEESTKTIIYVYDLNK